MKATTSAPPPPITVAQPPSPPPSESATNNGESSVKASLDAPNLTTPPFSPSSQTPILQTEQEEFEGSVDVSNSVPTEKELDQVGDFLLLDAQGQSRPFKELYNAPHVAPRQLIIFIRHFFCGNCQEYLRTLSSSITPDSLLALPTPTFITVIGCGKPELIPMYTETTKCPFPVYADPTRKLYDVLGMTRTFQLGPKPAYMQTNMLINSVQSIFQGVGSGKNAIRGGDLKQVGGEFLFEEGECTWVHRMRTTRDHTEVDELRNLLGLDGMRPPMRKRWSHGIKETKQERRSLSWGRLRSKSKGAKEHEIKPVKERESERSKESMRDSPPEKVEEEDEKKVVSNPTI
ncbi:AhpC/TSA antioxidant enzyme-domain-containing protein [Phaeosphaeriaceae sp. PMI808]|nr:AhpC/TSA antioxidant enzyme-domain-containing protein [Phaeosphaeriaceae sp. PMI808]